MSTTNDLHLTGTSLTITSLVQAARDNTSTIIPTKQAYISMTKNRSFAEKLIKRGDKIYGMSTGVGVRKIHQVQQNIMIEFQRRMVREHATGQGPSFDSIIIRASAIVLLNSICAGRTTIRPFIAKRISNRLSDGVQRPLRSIPKYGTTGMGDVTPLAHLAQDLVYLATDSNHPGVDLQAGEALPLIAHSSVVTGKRVEETRVLFLWC